MTLVCTCVFNTFLLPARHILTLVQDILASLFNAQGTVIFGRARCTIALNDKALGSYTCDWHGNFIAINWVIMLPVCWGVIFLFNQPA